MNVNIFLYDGFETLDVFGPAQIFGSVPSDFNINYLSINGDIVNSTQHAKIWTEELEERYYDNGILIIPGGIGSRRVVKNSNIIEKLSDAVRKSSLCIAIGTGGVILAATGCMYHRTAAYCNVEKEWISEVTGGVSWLIDEPWVEDGKYYTASNSMAGIDMTLDLIATQFDVALADDISEMIGYKNNI